MGRGIYPCFLSFWMEDAIKAASLFNSPGRAEEKASSVTYTGAKMSAAATTATDPNGSPWLATSGTLGEDDNVEA